MKHKAFFSLFLISTIAYAQGTSTGEANLKFVFPARVLSMGTTAVADTVTATSSMLNPASLANGGSFQVAFSQMQWIQDVQSQILTTSMPLSVGTASLTITNTSVNDIPVRDIPGPAIGTFNAHSTTFGLGYGLDVVPEVSLGATVKYLYDKMYVDDASGYGIDIGALYRTPLDGLRIGLAATNLGHMGAFRTVDSNLPTSVNLGAEYTLTVGDFQLVGAAALAQETVSGGTQDIRFGGEVTYQRLVALRVGYQTGYDVRNLSAGLGIHYSVFQLDYAYVPFSHGFGNANIVTLGIEF